MTVSSIDITLVSINLDHLQRILWIERDDEYEYDAVVYWGGMDMNKFQGGEAQRFKKMADDANWKGWIHVPVNQHIPASLPQEEPKEEKTDETPEPVDRSKGWFTMKPNAGQQNPALPSCGKGCGGKC